MQKVCSSPPVNLLITILAFAAADPARGREGLNRKAHS